MTLTTRTEMRKCGRRWPDLDAAQHSKRYLAGGQEAWEHPACAGVHLRPAGSGAKAAADTGPSRSVRALVLARDGYACARCGKPCGPRIAPYSLQHRVARGVGGDSSPQNLIVLCGTATSPDGCHLVAESRDREAQAQGYWLESWQNPLTEPVMYHGQDGGFTAWLCADGSLSFGGPEGAA